MNTTLFQKPAAKATHFYERYKKYLPVISFFGGFLWDSLTLTRIDRMSDNLILFGYILLLGLVIIILNLLEHDKIRKPLLLKYSEWYPLAAQFFLGGLFSSYVVFYFQSAALSKSWLFMGLLVALLIGNEFLEKRLTNIYLQMTLYFLVTFSFFIFFVPVLTGWMNVYTFILGGFLSLLILAALMHFLYRTFNLIDFSRLRRISALVVGIYLLLNVFYFFNLIPPVPLALKSGGIYHHVHRDGERYVLKFEKPGWYYFWKSSDNPYHYAEGDTVFCFAAVFAPTYLNKKIYHEWQKYDNRRGKWLTTDHLGYQVVGGRAKGYRGYTEKVNVSPGKWRVEVKTREGQVLGRIGFKIAEASNSYRPLTTIFH